MISRSCIRASSGLSALRHCALCSDAGSRLRQIGEGRTALVGNGVRLRGQVEHAADAVEVAAVLAATQVIVTAPAFVVRADRGERATMDDRPAMLANQRWAVGIGVRLAQRV